MTIPLTLCLLLVTGSFIAGSLRAQDVVLNVGDPAPSFEAPDADGERWLSDDVVGQKILVVYFYPGAMTGGCTKQACAYRDDRTKLTELGAEVVGISGDKVENLQVFRKAHRLNFPLLSDENGEVARAFGVPLRDGGTVKQVVDGEEVTLERDITTARWTFVIGLDGRIVYKNTQVDAESDSQAVMSAIAELRG
jgi:thioredoxin-dependent peroxiredoxin